MFDVFDSFHGQEEQDSFETNRKKINSFTGQVDNYLKNLKTVSESGIMVEASAIKSLKLLADKKFIDLEGLVTYSNKFELYINELNLPSSVSLNFCLLV